MTHINQRRDTPANWTLANPVLMLGEVGWETTTNKFKRGDGVTAWNSLPYVDDVRIDETFPAPAEQDLLVRGTTTTKITSADNYGAVSAKGARITDVGTPTASTDAVTKVYVDAKFTDTVLLGDPTGPTRPYTDSDTSLATTAFVHAALAHLTIDQQVFTASGTWTKPAGALYTIAEVQGGSGAGGGVPTTGSGQCASGGGGGAGGWGRSVWLASLLGATEAVTVGTAGAGAAGAVGGNGGTSIFKDLQGLGGTGGAAGVAFTPPGSSAGTGGAGGNTVFASVSVPGSRGGDGFGLAPTRVVPGVGGRSHFSNGGMTRVVAGNLSNDAGANYGGGGMGASAIQSNGAAVAGAAGSPGIVVVTTFCAP